MSKRFKNNPNSTAVGNDRDQDIDAGEGSSQQQDVTNEPSIEETCSQIQKAIVSLTKTANGLPVSDFPYYNTFESFAELVKGHRSQLLNMMTVIANKRFKVGSFAKGKDDRTRFDMLCDINDVLLDRVGYSLDDVEGLKKKNEALIIATLNDKGQSQTSTNPGSKYKRTYATLLGSKIVERPQVSFPDKIDNNHDIFIPRLKEKPNSIKPLAILPEKTSSGSITYSHPYELEIEKFTPSPDVLKIKEPMNPRPLEETPLIMVENVKQLQEMMNILKKEKEIAVDLEHHNYRSFQGFTCLIQISTRRMDFIVDALKLRGSLEVLNEVFTDPGILKVFHGSASDVIWLQRDFGVYIVNMFDTFSASKILGLARNSLAHLLKTYCDLEVNKEFQLADWRIRPLEEEMIKYARQDTHYLLYIYDRMRNDLIKKGNESCNLLRSVYTRSSQECLKKYEKPVLDQDSHLMMLQKSNLTLNSRQMFALQQIFQWRDSVARQEDESLHYVLPNHMMLQMAQILPREIQGILACCNPVPPLVKQNLNELHMIILRAREQNLETVSQHKKRLSCLPVQPLSTAFDSKHDVCPVEPDFDHALLESENGSEDVKKRKKEKNVSRSTLFQLLSSKTPSDKFLLPDIISPFDRYTLALSKKPILKNVKEEPDMEVTQVDPERKDKSEDEDEEQAMEISQHLSQIRQQTTHSRKRKGVKAANITPHEYSQADMNWFRKESEKKKGQRGKQASNETVLQKTLSEAKKTEKTQRTRGGRKQQEVNLVKSHRRGDMTVTYNPPQ